MTSLAPTVCKQLKCQQNVKVDYCDGAIKISRTTICCSK